MIRSELPFHVPEQLAVSKTVPSPVTRYSLDREDEKLKLISLLQLCLIFKLIEQVVSLNTLQLAGDQTNK